MPAPEGYVDRNDAQRITGLNRNHITQAARDGDIPGAFRRFDRGPWYFTESGLRQWIGLPEHSKVGVA